MGRVRLPSQVGKNLLTHWMINYLLITGCLISILASFQLSRLHGTTFLWKIGYFLYYVPVYCLCVVMMIFIVLPYYLLTSPLIVYREFVKSPGERTNDTEKPASRYIPLNVKYEVWKRDEGKCQNPDCTTYFDVKFGVASIFTNMHYDHIIPYSQRGASTANNLQLLCARCNWAKGAKLR